MNEKNLKNKYLVEKYPFLMPRNVWTDKISEDYDYSYTLLDDMPDAWRNAFGEEMCKELKEALIAEGQLEKFRITQIKEKYGTLRFYCNFETNKVSDIIRKYTDLSMMICIRCGKPTKYITRYWINYICEDCAQNYESDVLDKLTEEDIPVRQILYNGNPHSKIIHSFYEEEMKKQWK